MALQKKDRERVLNWDQVGASTNTANGSPEATSDSPKLSSQEEPSEVHGRLRIDSVGGNAKRLSQVLDALLTGYRLPRSLAGPGVRFGALSANRKTHAVA